VQDTTALVHDYLLVMRGAERTFAAMADCWPNARIATLLYDERGTAGRFRDRRVTTSRLQRARIRQRGFRGLLPLFPSAAERLPVAGADLVVSSSSAFAHGVRTPPETLHVCYCHSPFRYAWHDYRSALSEVRAPLRPGLAMLLAHVRRWDCDAARRTTAYIANSHITRERIGSFWGRDAAVVHPPVDVGRFRLGEPEDFFLYVGELIAHKGAELALRAAQLARQPIVVVGDGPDRPRLQAQYEGQATFVGRVPDEQLERLYARALAVVVPSIEEFGIVAVEAQAAGRPVIGFDAGGTLETVVDGETGVLVPPDDVRSMAEAMRQVSFDRYRPEACRRSAERFSTDVFKRRIVAEVARLTERAA
jgi:glycosyltransferase involved in cell wall biosynthesis